MSPRARCLVGLALFLLGIRPLSGQVTVIPSAGNAGSFPTNTGGYQVVFTVINASPDADTLTVLCTGNVLTTCTNVTPSSLPLGAGDGAQVTVTYSVGNPGSGKVQLLARSAATDFSDTGYYSVTVTGPPPGAAPLVSTAPTNSYYQKCAGACFAAVYSHSSPTYTSMGVARGFGLTYNSSTHVPMPVVQVDVNKPANTATPVGYSIQLKKSDGTFLTLQNGSTIAYYSVPGTFPGRMAAAFSTQANGIGTGAWDLTAVVTAYFASGSYSTNASVRVLVNDQSASQFGAGVGMAGLQQLRFLAGSSSVVITEGDGSISYYSRSNGTAPFRTPAGATDTLVYTGTVYRRYALDSSYVEFNAAGNMTKAVDRHANTTTISRYPQDSVPSRITDPTGRYIELCFGNTGSCYPGKLLRARVLTGAAGRDNNYLITGSGQLIRITDPDGYSDSLAYGGNGLLATVYDRARQRSDYTYDALLRVSQVQAPAVTLWDGGSARPAVGTTASEAVVWQPATSGTTQNSPKTTVKADTVRARITDPLGNTTLMAVDRFGGPTKVVDPYGATTTIARDTTGRPTSVQTPDGHVTYYNYTGYVLTNASDNTTGQTLNYTYRTGTNYLLKISGNTVRQDFIYTASNGGTQRALSKIYVNGTGAPGTAVNAQLIAWHKPDMQGRDTAVIDSLGNGNHFTYDIVWGNRLTTLGPTLKELARNHYDDRGRVVKVSTALSGYDTVAYGLMNQVTWSRTGLGLATTYQYDPATLLLTQLTDPKGQINKFAYNALGALTKQYAVGSTTVADSVGYDAAGQAVRIWRRGVPPIQMTYDKVGRPLSRIVDGAPTDFFLYDTLTSHWSVAYNINARDSVHLDLPARKSSALTRIGGRSYMATDSLNISGQRVGYVMTDVASGYTQPVVAKYSGAGLRDTLCIANQCMWRQRAGNFTTSLVTYDSAASFLSHWSLTQSSDASGRMTTQDFQPAALNSFDVTWTRDSLGRVSSRTKPGGTGTLNVRYDLDGRLKQVCDFCSPSADDSYDAAGNRTEFNVATSYGTDNRLVSRGAESFQYDANENLICRYPTGQSCTAGQVGKQYAYDALGRLTSVKNLATQAVLASYGYDALDRRVIRRVPGSPSVTELYIHHGDQVVMDVDSVSGQRKAEYVWVPGASDELFAIKNPTWGSGWNLAVTDPNVGTIRGVVRFNGTAVLKRYTEQPWGDTAADTGVKVRYRFAGASLEPETGLYYMRARFYDPTVGRFIAEDPIGIEGGANLFAYAGNDPINQRDPTGAMSCERTWQQRATISRPYPGTDIEEIIVVGGWVTTCNPDGIPDGGSSNTYASDTPSKAGGQAQAGSVPGKVDCKEEWASFAVSLLSEVPGAGASVKAIRAYRYGGRLARWGFGTTVRPWAISLGNAWQAGARLTVREAYLSAEAMYFSIGINGLSAVAVTPGSAGEFLLGFVPVVGTVYALSKAIKCQRTET